MNRSANVRTQYSNLPMTPTESDKLCRLISDLLDGSITPEHHKELADLLKTDKSARKVYLQAATMETQLYWQHGATSQTIEMPLRQNVVQGPWGNAKKFLAGAAAAAVAAGAWVATINPKKEFEPQQSNTIAEDLQPLRTETIEKDGQVTAHVYFSLNDQIEFPES
jgi:hypothetical protein